MSESTLPFLLLVSYLATGVALTGYDFSAPPLHQKGYVVKRDYKLAALIWFIWPLTAAREAYGESRLGRSGSRFVFGVLLLFGGMFLWGRVVVLLAVRLVDSTAFGLGLALVAMVLASPLMVAFAMPRHGR